MGLSAAPGGTPLHVAWLAEETVVQGVAALVRGLHGQEDPAVLQRQGTCGRTPGLSAAARSPPGVGAHLACADEMTRANTRPKAEEGGSSPLFSQRTREDEARHTGLSLTHGVVTRAESAQGRAGHCETSPEES